MKHPHFLSAALLASLALVPAQAQDAAGGLGEVVVTGNRLNARFAQQDRPVIGLRRKADSAVMQFTISSDSREYDVRKREIHAMLLSAIERAAAARVELVSGNFELMPVTKANYQELTFFPGNRVDTSRVDLMVKVKLDGTASAAEARLGDFIKSLPRSGRGAIDKSGPITLTIINPDQYRDAIVTLIAESARHNAGIFGPDYAAQISGIDGQVLWSQVSSTEVFLYVPYRFTIVPRKN